MGKIQIAIVALLTVAAISLYTLSSSGSELVQDHAFDLWKLKYSKTYADKTEEIYRMGVWLQHLKYVQTHNARYEAGKESFNLEMNAFADLTNEEYAAKYLIKFPQSVTSKCTGQQVPVTNLPDVVDWSTKGAVTPIKNQGQCGSCWAFSTTGSMEGVYFLKNKKLQSFSEQHLVDCSHSYGNNGCGGGLMNLSFFYVKDNGIAAEEKYPYKGVQGQCHYNSSTDKVWTITDCTEVTGNKEDSLRAAINQTPVSVAIEANHISFQLYKSGVYSGLCGTNLDHGVLAVGYGSLNSKPYFLVKNSWGPTWGDKGYIMIERTGDGKGKCGIQMAASFPIA